MRGVNPLKSVINEKRGAMRNLHSLKDIALEIFENRKAELKGYGKDGN